jgi:hypothetical protein
MPTDPDALRTALRDGSVIGYLPNQGQLFESIGSLLMEPGLTSEQRAALFQVVETMDGVNLLGEIADPRQRTGVGFSFMVGPRQQVLIFDPQTGQPLAFEEYSATNPDELDQWLVFDPPPITQP